MLHFIGRQVLKWLQLTMNPAKLKVTDGKIALIAIGAKWICYAVFNRISAVFGPFLGAGVGLLLNPLGKR